jgi:hypothetical protein
MREEMRAGQELLKEEMLTKMETSQDECQSRKDGLLARDIGSLSRKDGGHGRRAELEHQESLGKRPQWKLLGH